MKTIKGKTKVGSLNRRRVARLKYIVLWLGINPDLFRPNGTKKLVFLGDGMTAEFTPDADVITVLLVCVRHGSPNTCKSL